MHRVDVGEWWDEREDEQNVLSLECGGFARPKPQKEILRAIETFLRLKRSFLQILSALNYFSNMTS